MENNILEFESLEITSKRRLFHEHGSMHFVNESIAIVIDRLNDKRTRGFISLEEFMTSMQRLENLRKRYEDTFNKLDSILNTW